MKSSDTSGTPQMSNFWTGFTIGATALFFLGTKKGRTTLKSLLEYAENLEVNLDQLIDESMMKNSTDEKKLVGATNITELISRIQSAMPEKKDIKNFFKEKGKMLKSA